MKRDELSRRAVLAAGGAAVLAGTSGALAAEGARVAFCGRRAEEGRAVEKSIADAGGESLIVQADVTVESQVRALFEAVMATNLRGSFLAMKYEIPRMLATGGGVIVGNSSIAGLRALPTKAHYSAAKQGGARAVLHRSMGVRRGEHPRQRRRARADPDREGDAGAAG